MAADVQKVVGDAAASAFESLGGTAFADAATQEFGKWAGDFTRTIDTFIIVALLAFIIGILFMVLLRFFVGACVWIAVFATIPFFVVGGFFIFVLSGQCSGAGILETGKQVVVSVVIAGGTAASNVVTGNSKNEKLTVSEYGSDYRGGQRRTKSGKTCLAWADQNVLPQYKSSNYPDSGLTENFCRNPRKEGEQNFAKTIWCVTSDINTPWEECLPIGVIQPDCPHGYEISGGAARSALKVVAVIVWVLGIVWIILILCLASRIRLAIALNKVAADYLATHPFTVFVPVVQGLIGIIWVLLWFVSVSFLLSQVPASYSPQGYYETYKEAYGTSSSCAFWEFSDSCAGTPGACTNKWPTGFVWKDNDCVVEDGKTKCWRCAPPRYILDWRFFVSFFVFLWNNAFFVALGQMIIALAVSTWFFVPAAEKRTMFVVLRAVKTAFRYHIGSVAFGSFIIAVIQFIRYIMQYFEKQAAAQKNRVLVLILKCLQCCIWCFEKCIKFLNKNAYIQISLTGNNFCVSARKAFFLIGRNILRFGVIAGLGNMIHYIGFICICAVTCLSGYGLVRLMHPDTSPFLPLLCFGVVSYLVARLFMSVFGMVVDTALMCFIACEEMEVSGDFVPSALKKFVDGQDKKRKKMAEG